MKTPSFGDLLRRAILTYESQIGRRVPYSELGELIAKREGREPSYSTTAVSEWVNGRSEPGLETIRAIALTFGVTTDSLIVGTDVPQTLKENGSVPREAERPPWPGHLKMGKPPTATSKQAKGRRKKGGD